MDIHEPSVPSNENSSAGAANRDRKSVLELISEKDKLEGELSALGGTLESVSHAVKLSTTCISSIVRSGLTAIAWRRYEHEFDNLGRIPSKRS